MAYPELETKEFLKHYAETFVKVKLPKEEEWKCAYFRAGGWESPKTCTVQLHIGTGSNNYELNTLEFDLAPVKFGLYPLKTWGRAPVLVSRFPHRQWKWGLCRGNTLLFNIFAGPLFTGALHYSYREYNYAWDMKAMRAHNPEVEASVIKDVMSPEYSPDYTRAVDSILKMKTTFQVLDREHMLTISPIHPGLLLWKWDRPIAKLTFPSKEVTRVQVGKEAIFRQEVVDFYSRKGMTNVEFVD